MEIVVLRSDIARLVLGYLKSQQLEQASRLFCKTSPHLRQEFSAYKKGLQAYSFFPELEEIICEYVKITRKMEQMLLNLPEGWRIKLQHKKLSDKVSEFLDYAAKVISGSVDCRNKATECNSSSSTITNNMQSDKENNSKRFSEPKSIRKRKNISPFSQKRLSSSSLPSKRRRILEPFCYLGGKPMNFKEKMRAQQTNSSTNDEPDEDDDEASESAELLLDHEADEISTEEDHESNEYSITDKPKSESTPHNKTKSEKQCSPPSEMSQAILDNPEFQMKLVQNINQALLTSTSPNEKSNTEKGDATKQVTAASVEQRDVITTNQLLDEMVKNILAATEKDPSFDAIIEEVIGGINKPLVSSGVQCNMELTETSTAPAETVTAGNAPPRTPMVIHNALTAAKTNTPAIPDAQLLAGTSLLPNASFSSLLDPNFSISKLIVLNSNDSAQKQPPEVSLGNTTSDQFLNQLGGVSNNTNNTVDEQVYFDPSTGQLTFPLFLTNDGLLANLPFLVNNEVVTQQLQSNTIANQEASRIEIPLPEPIVVSADQLPPNSIIVNSTQKSAAEKPPTTSPQQDTAKKANDAHLEPTLPTSLNIQMPAENSTPSSSGIMNVKTMRSYSTPRKRASHVRTLTFSPRACMTPTSLSMNRFNRKVKSDTEKLQTLEKPVKPVSEKEKVSIKDVEVLPNLPAQVLEASGNESSNSCSVPPLFVAEESSNMTVIKDESACLRKEKPTEAEAKVNNNHAADTPKRKQPRKKAVDACKRRLSKSDEDVTQKAPTTAEILITTNETNAVEALSKEDLQKKQDQMLEEWQRMRSFNTSNLDSRLREINAQIMQTHGTKKQVRRKRVANTKKNRSMSKKKLTPAKNKNTDKSPQTDVTNENVEAATESNAEETVKESNTSTTTTESPNKSKNAAAKIRKSTSTAMSRTKGSIEKKRPLRGKQKEFGVRMLTPRKLTADRRNKLRAILPKPLTATSKQNTPIATGTPILNIKIDFKTATNETSISEEVKETQKHEQQSHKSKSSQGQKQQQQQEQQHENEKESASAPSTSKVVVQSENAKRTANMACLLETPYKSDVNENGHTVPPTPGAFTAATLNTPHMKSQAPADQGLSQTTYLFGSLTKSEIGTPMLTAITPGFRFTPFNSKDATPRSGIATDYSSGGSYYKPDESDEMDKNIDKMLRDSAQKRRLEQLEKEKEQLELQRSKAKEVHKPQFDAAPTPQAATSESAAASDLKVEIGGEVREIPTEKLEVEPIVLERVKTHGSEVVEGITVDNINPHYTLATGLPDMSVDEAESSSSSASSASASASSSSSSNSSASSNSSTSASDSDSSASSTETVHARSEENTPHKRTLSLENLSDISSAEDEEWQRLVVTEGENSLLVSQDGEVRYPVRSWLTPNKKQSEERQSTQQQTSPTITTTTITTAISRTTLMRKSTDTETEAAVAEILTESRSEQTKIIEELEQKRERIKQKLRRDSQYTERSAPSTSTKRKTTKATADKFKKLISKDVSEIRAAAIPPLEEGPYEEKRPLDVLTALNLSAKKQTPIKAPPCAIDDNAVSNIFDNSASKLKIKVVQSPLKTLLSRARGRQRKCVQIEPLMAPKRTRGAASQKKIVHTALNFKGQSKTEIATTTKNKLSPTTTTTKAGTANNEGEGGSGGSLRVSPRLSKGKKADELKKPTVGNRKTTTATATPGKTKITNTVGRRREITSTTTTTIEPTMDEPAESKNKKSVKATTTTDKQADSNNKKTVTATTTTGKREELNRETVRTTRTTTGKRDESNKETVRKATTTTAADKRGESKIEKSTTKQCESNKEIGEAVATTTTTATTAKEIKKLTNEKCQSATNELTSTSSTQELKQKTKTDLTQNVTSGKGLAPSKVTSAPAKLSQKSNDDHESSDEDDGDDVDDCEFVTITEENDKCFFNIQYDSENDGTKDAMTTLSKKDLSNFKMVVAIDEHEQHTWSITDDICLFADAPKLPPEPSPIPTTAMAQPIRNIPKKRKIRITGISDDVTVAPTTTTTTTTANTTAPTRKTSGENAPLSTSTPVAAKQSTEFHTQTKSTRSNIQLKSSNSSSSGRSHSQVLTAKSTLQLWSSSPNTEIEPCSTTRTTTTTTATAKDKDKTNTSRAEQMQIDDIESILSHIHGT